MSRKDISDKWVCKAYQVSRFSSPRIWPEELLHKWSNEPIKVCERAMERALMRGYIDFGVTLRTGWLTDKGLKLLEDSDSA